MLRILKERDEHKRDSIFNAMQEFVEQHGISNFAVHFITDKDVEKGVEHFNQLEEMDILCMGTHKRSGIEHLLKGSITEKLVNHLRKPMITYHLH
ncbi:MAG: universal stress protein [Flammeovirgaceae bacterium]|nr:universal stress protein [Flammeovirgaceae bacterium]